MLSETTKGPNPGKKPQMHQKDELKMFPAVWGDRIAPFAPNHFTVGVASPGHKTRAGREHGCRHSPLEFLLNNPAGA